MKENSLHNAGYVVFMPAKCMVHILCFCDDDNQCDFCAVILKKMKRIFSILTLVLLGTFVQAQVFDMMNSLRTVTLRARVLDKSTGEPVTYAAVCLTPQGDTTITAFGLSGEDGRVAVEGVSQGRYILTAEVLGYKSFSKDFELRPGDFERERFIGEIYLETDVEFIDAAKVSAAGNRAVTKRDTLVFNASGYKVAENAMLADLLKKLPGVKLGGDGSIKVNGESINRITVEGKTFFTKDPALAVKNLPAKIVNQIQVIDRPKEDASFSGVGTKEDQEKVMDLKLKDEYRKGWFGNAKVSGGASLIKRNDEENFGQGSLLYNANAMVSRFTPEDQAVFLASGKNADEPGAWAMDSGEYFPLPGADMDDLSMKPGLATDAQAGINYNTERIKGVESNISVSYNYKKKNVFEKSFRTSYQSGAADIFTDAVTSGTGSDRSITASMEFINSDKSRYLFVLRPFFMFSDQVRNTAGSSESKSEGSLLNRSSSSAASHVKSFSNFYDLELGVKNLGRTGRSLTLTGEMGLDNSKAYKSEMSGITFQGGNDNRHLNYDIRMTSFMPELELSYVEPFGAKWALQMRVSGRYGQSGTQKNAVNGGDGSANEMYSSLSSNTDSRIMERLLMQYKKDDLSLLFGLQLEEEQNVTSASYLGKESTVGKGWWLLNWAPYVDFVSKSDNSTLRLQYRGYSQAPSGKRILPAIDISNPVQITAGNIYLRPQFDNKVFMTYRTSNPKNYSMFEMYLDGGLTTRQVVSASWFDGNGLRYAIPVNSQKPGAEAALYLSLNLPFGKKKNFTLTLDGDAGMNLSTSYQSFSHRAAIDKDRFDYENLMNDIWGTPDGAHFYGGKSGFGQSATGTFSFSLYPGIEYRLDDFTARVYGFAMSRITRYSLDRTADMNTWDFNASAELLYSVKGWEFSSDIGYSFYRGYARGYGKPELIWNAGIAKDIGSFTLSVKAADIFNQQNSITRAASAEYMEDIQRNIMGRYFLAGITFNFGKLNASQGRKLERALWEMSF